MNPKSNSPIGKSEGGGSSKGNPEGGVRQNPEDDNRKGASEGSHGKQNSAVHISEHRDNAKGNKWGDNTRKDDIPLGTNNENVDATNASEGSSSRSGDREEEPKQTPQGERFGQLSAYVSDP